MTILIATNNAHKIDEIQKITNEKNIDLKFIAPKELEINIEPEETATTLQGNAEIKATAFYNISKIPTIADDSALEVEALDGLPGIYSARFALINAENNVSEIKDIDKANRQKLLDLLKNINNKNAQFRTVIAYYDGKKTRFFEGKCYGKIICEERGIFGFGYDPIFIPDGHNITFAEMTNHQKNSISHRYNAVNAFAEFMRQMLK